MARIQRVDVLTVLSPPELSHERENSKQPGSPASAGGLVFALCKESLRTFLGLPKTYPGFLSICGLGASSEHPSFQSGHCAVEPNPQMLSALTPSVPPPS